DALGAEDFFTGKRKKCSRLDRGIVGDDLDTPPGDTADASEDAGRRRPAPFLIHAPGCPQSQLKERCLGVEQSGDTLAGREAALLVLAGDRLRTAALHQNPFLTAEFFEKLPHSVKSSILSAV